MVGVRTVKTIYWFDRANSDVVFVKNKTTPENGLPKEMGGPWGTFNAWGTTYPYPN
jgi:hypothetical protein